MNPVEAILPNRALPEELPTRRAVCLLLDAGDCPVQALAWANPRAAMKRRLAEPVEGEKTRRISYGELVRSVVWRPVDSEFESDIIHAAVVREAFSQRAAELLKFPQPWFLAVDPGAEFPRWTRVERPGDSGASIGPLPDRATASRAIELLEDLFDLCRYYHILLEAPRGKACAYKDMGRCPAPCDGSVPMEQYRHRIAESAGALLRPGVLIAEIERQMQTAAGQLRFEAAGICKARLDRARELAGSGLEWAAPARQLSLVSAQPGPTKDDVKLFHVNLGGVVEMGVFAGSQWSQAGETSRQIALRRVDMAYDAFGFGPVMRHLFGDTARRRRFCRIEQLNPSWLAERLHEWRKGHDGDTQLPQPAQAPE